MLKGQIPRQVDPRKLALKDAEFDGEITTSELSRITESVLSVDSDVGVKVQFSRDEQGLLTVKGSAEAQVSLECQRCLECMPLTLAANINVAIARKEDDCARLPKYYDPWVVDTESADLIALIEDELLLALPIVALHEQQCAEFNEEGVSTASDSSNETEARPNPFSVLEKLKSGNKPTDN